MKADELQSALGITPAKLRELIKAGLPCTGKGRSRVFDPETVERWLLETGRAHEEATPAPPSADQIIARTIGEAAQLLGVADRNLAKWMLDPAFPGKAGSPGRRDGYFPIAEIQAWRAARFGADGRSSGAEDDERPIRREILEIKRDRERAELERDVLGTLIDAEKYSLFAAQTAATAKAIGLELADRLIAALPPMTERRRKITRKVANQVMRDVLEELARLVRDDDETKDDE